VRKLIAIAVVGMLMAGASQLYAHDEFRIIGTVTKVEAKAIGVKDRAGKTTVIAINKQTLVSREKKKVDAAELKAGRYVVVDAIGDTEDDLLALEVRLVAPPAK